MFVIYIITLIISISHSYVSFDFFFLSLFLP